MSTMNENLRWLAINAPDWVSPPGESILDIAEERGWTQAELAKRLGYTEKHVSQLINGKASLSVDAALRLERVVGGTVDFWLAREANYQNRKAKLEAAMQPGRHRLIAAVAGMS